MAKVAVVMGSQSDWATMRHAVDILDGLGVPHEVRVVSAHRTPDVLFDYASNAASRGLRAIIFSGDMHLSALLRADASRGSDAAPEVMAYELVTSGLAGPLSGGGWEHGDTQRNLIEIRRKRIDVPGERSFDLAKRARGVDPERHVIDDAETHVFRRRALGSRAAGRRG